ncbi:MAG TPA: 5-(carboxyamino)imidazole ribonucleotide synthase, partial [Streptosporangiaceae bacterium]
MVGGGQLARMTAQAAIGLGIDFRVLAERANDSAAQVTAGTVIGSHQSVSDVLAFAGGCDVVTFDHEHVPAPVLTELAGVTAVRPDAGALRF